MFPDDEDQSTAQDPNAPDGQDEGQEENNNESTKRNEGVEKRIAELTAKIHERDRRLEDLASQNTALVTARLTQTPQAPKLTLEEKYKNLDPEAIAAIREVQQDFEIKYGSALAATNARLESMTLADEARSLAEAKTGGNTEIAKQAASYASLLHKKGLPVNAEEATAFAIGQAVMNGTYTPGQAAQPQQRRGAAPLTGVRQQNFREPDQNLPPLPRNFEALSPEQQMVALKKRGVDDIPI